MNKWLDGVTNPSDANGSQGFPQALDGATPFEAVVPVDSGPKFSFMSELSVENPEVQAYLYFPMRSGCTPTPSGRDRTTCGTGQVTHG